VALDFKDFAKLKWYYQALIVAAVCGGLLALFWYQFLTPIDADLQARRSHLNDLQTIIAKSLQQQRHLAQIKKEAGELQAKLDMLKLVLPLEKETDQIFRAVQQQATTSALRIVRVAPRPTIDHEVYAEWPIDMEVIGTFQNIGVFLDRIRQLPRIVNITGLKLNVRSAQGDLAATQSVGATYVATTFVYKEEGIASTAPPPTTVK
jgi:type IV pilus assembly protein PilO